MKAVSLADYLEIFHLINFGIGIYKHKNLVKSIGSGSNRPLVIKPGSIQLLPGNFFIIPFIRDAWSWIIILVLVFNVTAYQIVQISSSRFRLPAR